MSQFKLAAIQTEIYHHFFVPAKYKTYEIYKKLCLVHGEAFSFKEKNIDKWTKRGSTTTSPNQTPRLRSRKTLTLRRK